MGATIQPHQRACPTIVVMGPSGSGKSTLGQALAAHLGWRFLEGDECHPPENLRKLSEGEPLTDADRRPFLDNIGRAIADSREPVVVSCSALRRAHRDRLRSYDDAILFVWVDVEAEELSRRVRGRRGHFMPPSLLADQLQTFEAPEPPERFVRVDGMLATAEQASAVEQHLAMLY